MAISQELLKRILLDQREEQRWPLIYIRRTAEKTLEILNKNQEIIVLTGIRRCGKSILLEHMRRVQASKNDYYFNFEDERLVNFSAEDFEVLHQTFISLYGIQKSFYLDEIQNIPGWELFVRRMYNNGCKVYITGSNANLFSEELGTRLTGRYIPLTIYPISFAEFSYACFSIPLEQQDFSTTEIGTLKGCFDEYLEYGGIPAYISNKNSDYLHSLYESILYRDIVTRYKIGNPEAMKKLLFFLASNCSKEVSYSSLLGMINNNGKIIKSGTTISDYCGYIENSFLCFFVTRYSDNLKSQQQSPKKVYFIDHVVARVIGFRTTEDRGRMLENIVFIELKRRKYDIYYYKTTEEKGSRECDFILRDGVQTFQVIQVCTELHDPATKEREILGLIEAMDKFALASGLIITENEEYSEIREMNNKKYNIVVKPLWKWLRIES
ncbi:MAG: ATP-binding protein [Gammaproteobacteria bacterium]|nr:ATP-binding protein [Gammaproteobacteria bacterium]